MADQAAPGADDLAKGKGGLNKVTTKEGTGADSAFEESLKKAYGEKGGDINALADHFKVKFKPTFKPADADAFAKGFNLNVAD
mmetsp:Transcript_12411/g.15395  ORF Transcript_12411/g.15395 Transcript_12411/m.15395 type:complete len:83 (+) Transcript_12411:237-485(+)|eukprot:CAMPEP_0204829934 /NCGR_PEP_ID=MMETSP1346-20131115/8232_1 /ASSEMBLY_ACC=CAM_ASM_000771 /TAXON_ID=215587 /ORGANISM="Aplanochytrium stocchinoi, Strain GSBS06" /LENGTH=82 /DNA_ID=CAMNT_0051960029 /DNA_START=134 /DNA_END=382 /DNA_ORIENTATION=+